MTDPRLRFAVMMGWVVGVAAAGLLGYGLMLVTSGRNPIIGMLGSAALAGVLWMCSQIVRAADRQGDQDGPD